IDPVCYTCGMNLRYRCATLATLVAAPLPIGAGVAPSTYHVVYHGKDLGMWDTLTIGCSKHDRTKLFASLPAGNDPLVVTQTRNGKPNGVTTCPKSYVSDFGIDGSTSKSTEAITFACTSVSTN
ncbi:MAG TPA: hypothetical protein VFE36_13230, partial [Candidatus Baltobacteraceae bacterium]|nr:hypothetical protein [Candidatus Baltobacteraceae bacterium]